MLLSSIIHGFLAVPIMAVMNQFLLQRAPETLHGRIVVIIASAAHRDFQPKLPQKTPNSCCNTGCRGQSSEGAPWTDAWPLSLVRRHVGDIAQPHFIRLISLLFASNVIKCTQKPI